MHHLRFNSIICLLNNFYFLSLVFYILPQIVFLSPLMGLKICLCIAITKVNVYFIEYHVLSVHELQLNLAQITTEIVFF